MKPRLLVTGAGGIVGTGIREHLAQHFDLRLSMRKADDVEADGNDLVIGDITDPSVVDQAVAECDAVLHLAAVHGTGLNFEETLDVNYHGLVTLMEAATAAGVRHVLFASSNHGWGMWPRSDAPLTETAPPRPDGWYGVSKIFGEAVMAYYADTCGISTTSLRIGNCGPVVEDERRRHMWISFRDLAELIRLLLEQRRVGHRALWATADCVGPFFDNSGLADIGFVARDRPDDNLAEPEISTQGPATGIAGTAIGGSYAEANFRAHSKGWSKS